VRICYTHGFSSKEGFNRRQQGDGREALVGNICSAKSAARYTTVNPTRRQFIRNSALAGACTALTKTPLSASIARTFSAESLTLPAKSTSRQLSKGWEHFQGEIASADAWSADVPWTAVALPHCIDVYHANDPDVPYYRGVGWYRAHLKVANPFTSGRTLLHFEGAGQVSTLYVGETLVGKHTGGYDEFLWDITDAIAALPNHTSVPISVLCDNQHDDSRMPSDKSDFNMYAGLYRHVNLVYVPAVSVASANMTVKLPDNKADYSKADISVTAVLHNPAALDTPLKVTATIHNPDGTVIQTKTIDIAPWLQQKTIANFTIASPELWSPDTPSLYACSVTIESPAGVSTLQERFGVRRTEFIDHGPFLLNGQRLLLCGTQRHMDHAVYGAAVPDEVTRQEFQLVKEMGANFIRLAHYQQSKLVLDLCDGLGILVWEELVWCHSGVVNEMFKQMGRDKLTNMIQQHYNHPSVLLWSLGNEDDSADEAGGVDREAIRAYMTELRDLAHQLDPGRLTSIRRCDFAIDIPDVYSPSLWPGWHNGHYTDYQQTLERERERVKHMIHMEWGAEAHARRHSENPDELFNLEVGRLSPPLGRAYEVAAPSSGRGTQYALYGDFSETYACNLFDWYLKTQELLPWFVGSAQWIFKDFSTPKRPDNPVPRVNQKGLLERDMTKKEGYYVFQSYWAKKPMAHIYGHSWLVRWGTAGEVKTVKVFSNCPSAELFLNGKTLGVRQRDSQNYPAAGLHWMIPFLAGKNHLRVVATQGSATVTDEIEFLYQTERWGEPASFRMKEIARHGDVVTVQAQLVDVKGVRCLDARNRVRFALNGAGSLCDNLGTSTGSRVVELYNGCAEISINRGVGSCSITLDADKLPATTLTIA
jgi:beta-galactosidase